MNKKTIIVLTGLISILSSCHTYKEYDKESFPNYVWSYGQEITFTPDIKDISKTYKLILGLRHIYGLQLESLSVRVKTISPSGKEEASDYDFQIMEGPNKYKGSCAGDLCDLETLVNENLKFTETGVHKFIVTHNIPSSKVPGVMELGLIIDEQ